MIEKGNVLQYKKNSSNLTKQQRYSKIVTGKWANRNSTLATQGLQFTDPNTRKLKRVNYRTIFADDGTDANLPVTCPETNCYSYTFYGITAQNGNEASASNSKSSYS